MSEGRTFVDRYRAGELSISAINDYVDMWHLGVSDKSLAGFLGLSKDQYQAWVEGRSIEEILK